MKRLGVYAIENIINGKLYIGSSVDLDGRKNDHWSNLRNGRHHNAHLQASWNKYGCGAFVFRVLEECDNSSDLVRLEQKYIDELKSKYNMAPASVSVLGIKRTDEFKEKISKARKGIPMSEENKQKHRKPHKPHPHRTMSDEHRENISIACTGKKRIARSDEAKQKDRNNGLGRLLSDETKQKISRSLKKYFQEKKGG